MKEDKGFTYEGPDKKISPEMQAAKRQCSCWEKAGPFGGP